MTREPLGADFPAYAFLPGHRPHPTLHADGHSYGKPESIPAPLDPTAWEDCEAYLRGFALFERGYYWEAHEAWEGLWIAAGRRGAQGELFKGLIKLAAAGLKVRQGISTQVTVFGARAADHFLRAQELCGQERFAGLAFSDLLAFSAYLETDGAGLKGSPELAIQVVFPPERSPRLAPRR